MRRFNTLFRMLAVLSPVVSLAAVLATVPFVAAGQSTATEPRVTEPRVTEPDATEIVRRADAVRNPDGSFTLRVRLIEYRDNKQEGTASLRVYARLVPERGQFDNLVQILEPPRDAGKLMLKNGNEIWLYDPASRSSVRISPEQRLLGQASNGDVVTVNLAKDYDARLVKDETIQDGDQRPRECHLLKLSASSDDVPYAAIDYWVEKATYRPVKAQFLSASGRTLKTAFYRHYREELGRERATETVILDGLNKGWITIMQFGDYEYSDISEIWFKRANLSSFRGTR